ncbi:MAG: hypothetical protein K4571_20615 [Deltaproteobacteria bacterium]
MKKTNLTMMIMMAMAVSFLLLSANAVLAGGGAKYKIKVKSPDYRCSVLVHFANADPSFLQDNVEKGESRTFGSKGCPTQLFAQCWTAVDYVTDITPRTLDCESATFVIDAKNKVFHKE